MQGTTTSSGAKFAIGMLAGIAAVMLPRLLALLSKSDDAQIVFFPLWYFMLAGGVGLFLGLVMLVLEYEVAAKPKETFMAALGLPAVLSGALGTASTAENASDLAREAARLRDAVREEQHIGKGGAFTTFEPLATPAPAKPPAKGASLGVSFIASAHAQDSRAASVNDPVRFGVRVEQRKYIVVLKQSPSAQQAQQEAQRLQGRLPAARAIRSDKGYFVALGSTPMSETDALFAATQARKAMNDEVQPVLVEVR